MSVWRRVAGVTGASIVLVSACTTDPKVEDELPPPEGAAQPATASADTVGVDEACQAIRDAESAARGRLGCGEPEGAPGCPEYLAVAGARACAEVFADTVEACVDIIGGYAGCGDFDSKGCVVTVAEDSCVDPEPPSPGPEAGVGGSGGGPGDAAVGGSGGDGGAGAAGDAGDAGAAPPDGSLGEGGPSLEGGGSDDGAAPEGGSSDAATD